MDSSSILFKDDQFEDVSKVRKAFCWTIFLLDKETHKAKCKVKISEGKYCDRIISARFTTNNCNQHLKNCHGILFERSEQ